MLIVALVLAVIGLAALVTAVVTGNEVIAWVCIGASVIGVLLLIIDAVRERNRRDAGAAAADPDEADAPEGSEAPEAFDADYPDDPAVEPAPEPTEEPTEDPAADPTPDPGTDDTTEFARLPESADDTAIIDPIGDEVAGEDRGTR